MLSLQLIKPGTDSNGLKIQHVPCTFANITLVLYIKESRYLHVC